MEQFGTLKKTKLRSIWEHEAHDFTPWLADNLNVLGESLGMSLELEGTEVAVGGFSLDLQAIDLGSGDKVVIENQLETTNHPHLGQLLTYAAKFDEDSTTVIWIAKSFRKEHRKALEWLNHRTDSDTMFFGVIVEVISIDDSKPVCYFKPAIIPSKWPRNRRKQAAKGVLVNGKRYQEFFQALIDDLRENYQFTNDEEVGETNSWEFSSGNKGVRFCAAFYQHEGGRPCIEVYIDLKSKEKDKNKEFNKALFDALRSEQKSIEESLSAGLNWERQDDYVTSRIRLYRDGSIESSSEELKKIHAWMIENLLAFKKIFSPIVAEWQKENIPQNTGAVSVKDERYQKFFQSLIDDLRENHQFTNARSGQLKNWYAFSSGFRDINLSVRFTHGNRARVYLYIDQEDAEVNKEIFYALHEQQDSIERELGVKLDWDCPDNSRFACVALYRSGSIESSEQELKEIHAWMVKNLLAFKQVFSPRIKAILG